MSVAALLMVTPYALGARVAGTIGAPYTGVSVQPWESQSASGCATLKAGKPWNFLPRTGVAGVVVSGKAPVCANGQFGFGTSSSASDSGAVSIALPFRVASGNTHIQVNLSLSWAVSARTSDGGHALCTANENAYDDTSVNAEWNYTKTPIGSYYASTNSSSTDRSGSPANPIWSNSSSGTAAPPVPFPFTSTSHFQWTHTWGGSSSCSASASVSGYASASLVDESNGTTIPMPYNTVGSYGQLFNFGVSTYNYTSWGCSNSTTWDGPTATWSNGSTSCYSGNGTVTSSAYTSVPYYGYLTSNVGGFSLVSVLRPNPAYWYWNYRFNASHHFELFLTFGGSGSTSNDWPLPGTASFSLNLDSLGYAIRLGSLYSY